MDDYPELMEICFNNREADIGGFLRRQLGQSDVSALGTALRELLGVASSSPPEKPSFRDKTIALMRESAGLFQKASEAYGNLSGFDSRLTMQVGLILNPEKPHELPTRLFLDLLARANPKYSGWPIWLDSRDFPILKVGQ
jgi:hypothetical protein